jgi:hypothetical protein
MPIPQAGGIGFPIPVVILFYFRQKLEVCESFNMMSCHQLGLILLELNQYLEIYNI